MKGSFLVTDDALKKQLIDAREKIESQLRQLEAPARGLGDCRAVYADLQRELREIDALLETDGTEDAEPTSASQPMVNSYSDVRAGSALRQSRAGMIVVIITIGFFVLYMGAALFRALAG